MRIRSLNWTRISFRFLTRDSHLLEISRPLPEVGERLERDAARRAEPRQSRVVLLGVVGIVLAERVRTTALFTARDVPLWVSTFLTVDIRFVNIGLSCAQILILWLLFQSPKLFQIVQCLVTIIIIGYCDYFAPTSEVVKISDIYCTVIAELKQKNLVN